MKIKKVSITSFEEPATGKIIDSMNPGSDQETNAPSINAVKEYMAPFIEELEKLKNSYINSMTYYQVGEYDLYNSSGKAFTGNGSSYQWLATCYNVRAYIEKKYPLREGFTRKYKINFDWSDSIATSGMSMHFQFKSANLNAVTKEFLPGLTWGGTTQGIRRSKEPMDFNIDEVLPNTGHFDINVTPSFAVGSVAFIIYRVYLLVYDIPNDI